MSNKKHRKCLQSCLSRFSILTMAKVDLHEYMSRIGRKGGLKGGKARKRRLSPERRSEIARKAARARWRKARRPKPPAGAGRTAPARKPRRTAA